MAQDPEQSVEGRDLQRRDRREAGADPEAVALEESLGGLVGRAAPPRAAIDPVNATMIRQWCEALGEHNPVYLDPERARRSLHGRLVAPPAMLDAWLMPGQAARRRVEGHPFAEVLPRLDAAGYVGVVATRAEHEYDRYLAPGDRLTAHETLEAVSPEKRTALGPGRFVTTVTEYRDADDRAVGRMRWSILKFRPAAGGPSTAGGAPAPASPGERPRRPRPGISRDTRFFWDGLASGELRIQRCGACGALHHPPVVRCPGCGSYDLGFQVASGRGHLYSFVEVHHPQLPSFDYPLLVALVELEEGTRLIAGLSGMTGDEVEIGLPLEVDFERVDPELTLPVFRPRRPERREAPRAPDEIAPGDRLAPCVVPITRTLIVAGAIATRDFTPVHHDPVVARRQGTPDIFMNILTTNGLCTRYVTDWAGPDARLTRLAVRLGVPNFPDDVMTLRGRVERVDRREDGAVVEVSVRGSNRLGDHANARVDLWLAGRGQGAPR